LIIDGSGNSSKAVYTQTQVNQPDPTLMARLPRFVMPGYPQHVIQRGNNRQQILFEEEDYWFIWDKLGVAAEKFQCDIHAYVLMPNHFHLLLTPYLENGIGKLMQYVGRYYVQYFNGRHERRGTLWEGRYRATLVDPKDYLLAAAHYIESNPVRAGLVTAPAEYGWSSYGGNAEGIEDRLVTPHREYERLGRSAKARREHYAAEAGRALDEALIKIVKRALGILARRFDRAAANLTQPGSELGSDTGIKVQRTLDDGREIQSPTFSPGDRKLAQPSCSAATARRRSALRSLSTQCRLDLSLERAPHADQRHGHQGSKDAKMTVREIQSPTDDRSTRPCRENPKHSPRPSRPTSRP
jgi:putative transposase